MSILYADEFKRRFMELPQSVQRLYRKHQILFRKNWRAPRLHVKKLIGHPLTFSFRITRRHRVLFAFVDRDTILFLTIGHRASVYRR